MYGAVAIHAVTDQAAFHTRHVILGFVAGGCGLINHNHHDSERLELCFGTGIWLFLDRENKIFKRRKSVRIIVLLVLSGRLSNCRIFL